jgi:hypothetical protein
MFGSANDRRSLRNASLGALSVLAIAVAPACYHGLDRAQADADASGDGADEADGGAASSGDDGPDSDPLISECRRPSYEVFLALEPSCAGCHGEGTSVPLMQDFVAFEQLVITDETLVVRGDPDASRLLAMLRGEGPPPLSQMPPGARNFADLEADGETGIGLAELAKWIEELEPCDMPGGSGSPQFARRVSVEQIRSMLFAQLGLSLADVEYTFRFPIDDPTFPTFASGHNSRGDAEARWRALGGPDLLRGDIRSADWNPLFTQTIGPMAQAWCRYAIDQDSPLLLRHATRDSDSAVDEAAIRSNIEYLHLHMLGVVASEADVEAMYEGVYREYEATADARTAWTAVCAALVRDPLWQSL